MPILPTILINGAKGIGTGWSTFIPTFNPIDIANNILMKLEGNSMKSMKPWFKVLLE